MTRCALDPIHAAAANGDGSAEPCSIPQCHEMDLALCADLERLADGLPALCSNGSLRKICERLLAASARWSEPLGNAFAEPVEIATACRIIDSIHAEDVVDTLWDYWRQADPAKAEQLAYMLRALFDGRRRAIAIERLALGCSACQSSEID